MPRPPEAVRKRAGITFEQAAVLLRVSHGYLRSIERGHRPLPVGLAGRMAHRYQCDIFELYISRQ